MAIHRLATTLLFMTLACAARDPRPAAPAEPAGPATPTAVTTTPELPTAGQVENLRAFARVYGYVRWFHPSDEASVVDWTALAALGANEVRNVADADALQAALERLFLPVAPTLRIYREGQPAPDLARLTPADTTGLTTVAWQYLGPGSPDTPLPYVAKRTGRVGVMAGSYEGEYGKVSRTLEPGPLRGKQLRVRVAARVWGVGQGDIAKLYVRVARPGERGTLRSVAIHRTAWTQHELSVRVPDDADVVSLGALLTGRGPLMLDDFEVAVQDPAGGDFTPLALTNPGFEAGTDGWKLAAEVHDVRATGRATRTGKQGLWIRRFEVERNADLFAATPAVGEAVDVAIGRGLRVQVPLALYSKDDHTLGSIPAAFKKLQATLAADRDRRPDAHATLKHPDLRAAAVVVAWNVLQHFYPYFDVIKVDWEAALVRALEDSVTITDELEFFHAVKRMVAGLADGHGFVIAPELASQLGELPLHFVHAEGVVAVLSSTDRQVQPGDVLEKFDGVPAADWLATHEARASGSPQRRRLSALHYARYGRHGTTTELELRRGAELVEAKLTYGDAPPPGPELPPFERHKDGVYYIHMGRAMWSHLEPELPQLLKAKGLVLDVREGVNDHTILLHLMSGPDGKETMKIPQIVRPDHVPPAGWIASAFSFRPQEPRIKAKVAWLIDAHTQSYPESVTETAAHYRIGELVGERSSGANGNVRHVTIPGEIRVTFTGMVVQRRDGSTFHTLGIQPTIPQSRTLAGIRAGRDEILERGLAVVRAR